MRFRIAYRHWNASEPLRLHIDESVIPIRMAKWTLSFDYNRLAWTWIDGCQYLLRCPIPRLGKVMEWAIDIDDEQKFTGHLSQSFWFPFKRSFMEWHLKDGESMLYLSGCRAGTIVNSDRRVFARWKPLCRGREVVIRPRTTDMLAGILVGMLVADCWEAGSC
jgi:hypothetical protein